MNWGEGGWTSDIKSGDDHNPSLMEKEKEANYFHVIVSAASSAGLIGQMAERKGCVMPHTQAEII